MELYNNTPTMFKVIRTDDNGCEYVIARGLSENEAGLLVERMTALGHKQLYDANADVR
jgi:hypothetical protein